ncbi:hypothetical protein Bca52824_022527 [Brassica carinata]|uniref:Protein kinase domain-containing protein n=1 Tax=Brassica carinata TaxID=52824 RepID=A0A8X7VGG8_BRACI|nr:hypothetical protein Bca52824_022527 [Brassica carinata]
MIFLIFPRQVREYENISWALLPLIAFIHIIQAQGQQGFISLDCGLPATEASPYEESYTKLLFSSDETFIRSGRIGETREDPVGYAKPYKTLRYFPDEIRNCYSLKVEKGRTHMIVARFVYGNYDGLKVKPKFDLYLGPNLWATIDLQRLGTNSTSEEILHMPTSDSLQICLVKTGETTPFISALEIRALGNDSYITKSGSLKRLSRRYFSKSGSNIRYMKDVYDREWVSYGEDFQKEWTQISTALEVNNSNKYVPPKDALINAATPTDASAPLTIELPSGGSGEEYHLYAHFSEIQDLQANDTRELNISLNGEVLSDPIIPKKLDITTVSNVGTCQGRECLLQLTRTSRSTLPPIINALEVYTSIRFPQSETDENDVAAIKNIEDNYSLSRINWQGDPCVPRQFLWDGLNCSNTDMSIPPRITSLNLSSSGLTGNIAAAVQNLTHLEKLDLSNNNLTGGVPEFLGNMKFLMFINLSGNNFNGSIPQALQKKGLELLVEGNPMLCLSNACSKRSNVLVPIVASTASAAVVIAVLVLFLVLRKKKSTTVEGTSTVNDTFANKKSRRFTYSEVMKMTNNFQRVIGKGGSGMVYQGTVNGSEVAVKLLSQSSTQGYEQFKAEVDLLLRVHHTNLVSLVGYCYEGDHLALICEFLPNGDLKQHLSGKGGRSIINWSIRLRIALETALGLEYLHIGCTPPMVHRDVKTANILLDENFKAKLADFGISRSFGGRESQEFTEVAGTHGYIDPEYNQSGRLHEKSDVFSFGIVLLEMITNRPVISQTSENSHITEWVGSKLKRGDIVEIIDPNLREDYDSNSAWRALELAMSCANPSSSKRPSMSQVIHELKECIVGLIEARSAKVEVEINMDRPLKFALRAQLPSGEIVPVKLVYSNLHRYCRHCRLVSHELDSCPQLTEAERTEKLASLEKDRDQTTSYRFDAHKLGENSKRSLPQSSKDRRSGEENMKIFLGLLLPLIAFIHIIQAQGQQGFISLDCGLPATEASPYEESYTKLLFSSDETFIRSGRIGETREDPVGYAKPYKTLRYFPDEIRNCYSLKVEKGRTHMIVARFVYGNYDGLKVKPKFDLYLGPNLWATIDLQRLGTNSTSEEILHMPTSDSLQICLVKTGETTPFISALEIRALGNDSYITKSGSLKRLSRRYFSKSGSNIRYMKDVYDREWVSYGEDFQKEWTQISTALEVNNSNKYVPPKDALINAATPTDASAPLTIELPSGGSGEEYHLYAHFSEIQDLQANDTRELNISLNGEVLSDPIIPKKLDITTVSNVGTCQGRECLCSLQEPADQLFHP